MQDLKIWEEKIKAKRKQTDFREFVKEIASWQPLTFYNINWKISRYHKSNNFNIIDDLDFANKSIKDLEKWNINIINWT